MKNRKSIIIVILTVCLFYSAFPEERVKPLPMKELTNPSSPSFVPFPYPKKRKEIIDDLNYAIKKLFPVTSKEKNKQKKIELILNQLSEDESLYHIGPIIKVKNRTHRMAHDYTWLIPILDNKDEVAARIVMEANGLYGGFTVTGNAADKYRSAYPNSKRGPQHLILEQDVLTRLAMEFERPVDSKEILKMERVAYQSTLGALFVPVWTIKLKSGKTLYYSVRRDTIYEVEKKIPWKRTEKGYRKGLRELVPHLDVLPDTIDDEVLVLKQFQKDK